jgi:hypothetical protein
MAGNGFGVPDGQNLKTIVVDHRQTVVIQGIAGEIVFAIHPSQYGAVALGVGFATVTLNSMSLTTGVPPYYQWTGVPVSNGYSVTRAPAPTNTLIASNYDLLPFLESYELATAPVDQVPAGRLTAVKSRVITTTARVMFTGSTLADNGSAATCKMPAWTDEVTNATITQTGTLEYLKTVGYLPARPPLDFQSIAGTPGSRVFPVRESIDVVSVPTDYEYSDIRPAWVMATRDGRNAAGEDLNTIWFAGLASSGTSLFPVPVPNNGHADTIFYAANGLATGTNNPTVTVEVRTCVEYALSFNSTMARFSAPAAPKDQMALDRVQSIARQLPSSRPTTAESVTHGWIPEAVGWYGRTMKSIVGNVWGLGAKALEASGIPPAMAIGGVIDGLSSRMTNMALTKRDPYANSNGVQRPLAITW